MSSFDNSMMRYLIGRSRIKYSKLDDLFRELYIPQSRIVIHVDASAILYRLYREKDLDMLYAVDQDIAIRDLVISFLNALGHYRRYIMTRLGKTNDILIYFNRKPPVYQQSLFSDYRKKWYRQLNVKDPTYGVLNHIVHESFKFIQGLLPYFEGIYLIDGNGVDDYTAIYHMIHNEKYQDYYHLIFSQNMLATQLMSSNVAMLYNKRNDSFVITSGTVYQRGILRERKAVASDRLTAEFLPFIWALGGCNDINMKKSKFKNGVVDTIKLLNPLVDQQIITGDMSIQTFLKTLSKHIDRGAELRLSGEIVNRYRVVQLSLSDAAITEDQKVHLAENIVDLYDQTGLEEINNRLAMLGEETELLEITNLNMSTSLEDEEKQYQLEFSSIEDSGFSW